MSTSRRWTREPSKSTWLDPGHVLKVEAQWGPAMDWMVLSHSGCFLKANEETTEEVGGGTKRHVAGALGVATSDQREGVRVQHSHQEQGSLWLGQGSKLQGRRPPLEQFMPWGAL